MTPRKYGRHAPPPLPAHRMLTRTGVSVQTVDLRSHCGPVKDQGSEGSCTGHAGTSAAEWIWRKYFAKSPVFSPQYTYVKELILDGNFPEDDGSNGETLCHTLIFNGCCNLASFPYIPGQIVKPTPDQDQDASHWRLGAFHGLAGSQVALSVLGDPVPWPVMVGFTVYQSFEGEQLAETGVMPVPAEGESVLGGHEVLAIGYDTGVKPTIRPATCSPAFLIQNSWGTGWGQAGFFWMPVEIFDRSDTDLKIAHSGHPWRP